MSREDPKGAKFTTLTSAAVLLVVDDVDTDQIIPARFLKVTSKDGLAQHLFSDWRYDASGAPRPDFALNREQGQVLIAGHNFGCGSSREHAPWALVSYGFRAVVATSFADIFKNNALKNGLVPVEVSKADHARLVAARQKDAALEVTVDLEAQTVSWPGQAPIQVPVDSFARRCLLDGTDELGTLLALEPEIAKHEAARS